MMKPTAKRVVLALVFGLALLLLAAWLSGSHGEICEHAKPSQEQCPVYNLAAYFLLKTVAFLNESAVVITALATAVIGYFTYTLGKSTEQMRNITQEATNIAAEQMLIAGRQTDIIEKQHALERLQFIAENRPRLKIRSISITRPTGQAKSPLFQEGKQIVGSLVVVNTGETAAEIIDSSYRFFWELHGLPMEPPLGEEVLPLFDGEIPPLEGKESRLLPITSVGQIPAGVSIGRHIGGRNLYLMGLIRYTDIGSPPKERFTGFCRVYVPGQHHHAEGYFQPIENTDYEFED